MKSGPENPEEADDGKAKGVGNPAISAGFAVAVFVGELCA